MRKLNHSLKEMKGDQFYRISCRTRCYYTNRGSQRPNYLCIPNLASLEDAEIKIATQKDENLSGVTRIRKSTVGGVDYRILSKSLPRGGLLQIGRDLSEVNDAISGMIRAFLLLGLIGIAIAILSAWVLASQLAKPIKRLSKTAEHVARTQELTAFIDSKDGDKEVRRLAESFNVMLRDLQHRATSKRD